MSFDSLLKRKVKEVIDATHLTKRLEAGEKLRVKLGIDPTTPHLHIGHAVPLKKLREFQDEGHTAVLIIGDYTAQIGDPTGKSEVRTMLTPDQVKANAEDYLNQAYKVLDKSKTEVHFQSEWFNQFTLRDVIEMMSATTVNHLLSHETFQSRLDDNQPLYMHEIMYPLIQGFDSAQVKADIELGGIDQKFNILMGRVIQRAHNLPEQDVMLFPYLPGTDGQEKMSKSLGNTINLTDAPQEMFGKVMSLKDELMPTFFELATALTEEEVKEFQSSTPNPRDLKVLLAKQIVTEYYSAEAADEAARHFDAVFRKGEVPSDIQVLSLPQGKYDLVDLLVNRSTLAASKSEARRLIIQGGVKVNKIPVTDPEDVIESQTEPTIIQVGPRRFLKIEWK